MIQTLEPHQFQEMKVFSHAFFFFLQGFSLQRRTQYIYIYIYLYILLGCPKSFGPHL